jgi:predicted RNA-binding Zn ribbon-like protein
LTITGQGGDVAFEFIADLRGLDFVATLAERGTTDLEHLVTPGDLSAWVQRCGLVDDDLTLTEADLHHAKAVREALFAVIAALIGHSDPDSEARDVVNAAAAHGGPWIELDAAGIVHRSGDLAAVLAALATEVIALHASPDRHSLRWCDDPRCTRPFIDRSRGHRRRWCGMKGCGDRSKAAAYRQRQRTA